MWRATLNIETEIVIRSWEEYEAAIKAGDYEEAERNRTIFQGLEDLRNLINPIRVLHAAVELAGIAKTGPLLPLLSNVSKSDEAAIAAAAKRLLAHDREPAVR